MNGGGEKRRFSLCATLSTFHCELVSPERLVFSGEVNQVDVPGEEGEFGVLAGHAPYIATLKPGMLTIYGDGVPQRIVVRGGFAEMGPTGLTVLAVAFAVVLAVFAKPIEALMFGARFSSDEYSAMLRCFLRSNRLTSSGWAPRRA